MKVVVVAEKPSVARDIAAALGGARPSKGYLTADGDHAVTWAIGHLVALGEPHDVHPDWRRWHLGDLPLLPAEWPLIVLEKTAQQFAIVKELINKSEVDTIICATDAGREGELIFRYIYEKAGCTKPVRRLWISSLTPEAIRAGMRALRDARCLDPLARSAVGRSRADWLVGINLSRLYSLKYGDNLAVGRVQTPTLALLVDREQEIAAFVPRSYLEVQGSFELAHGEGRYDGMLVALDEPSPAPADRELAGREPLRFLSPGGEGAPSGSADHDPRRPDKAYLSMEVEGLCAALAEGSAAIARLFEKIARLRPPQPYDLTELQRAANRLHGFSAERTLAVAQQLYEKRKLISYPRTDSRYLSVEIQGTLGPIAGMLAAGLYRGLPLLPQTGTAPLDARYVDNSKVGDHHAIIPTPVDPAALSSGSDEFKIYDLIARRFLALWQDDHISATTNVVTRVAYEGDGGARKALFLTKGTRVLQLGWKVLEGARGEPCRGRAGVDDASRAQAGEQLPPQLAQGAAVVMRRAVALEKTTRPPPHYNDASLLTAMETAGKQLDDREFPDVMRNFGLGTPATRAATIESLIGRGYAVRDGKRLVATAKGCQLIAAVHPDIKSPALTGVWEGALKAIADDKGSLETFMTNIREMVGRIVGMVKAQEPQSVVRTGASATPSTLSTPPASFPAPAREARADDALAPSRDTIAASPRSMTVHARADDALAARRDAIAASLRPTAAQGTAGGRLDEVLQSVFGFSSFRPHQRSVCQEVVDGHDVLLVMPTGAGKSLCYQLPALVRGGTTLVISPLIALMEDQVQKACALGIRAGRIHSGLDNAVSREACRLYVAGELDLLYIAPERLSLPRFVQFLAQHPPSLVAVDEAHCISHWGHDFRPDYRMIGDKLPMFRPAPVIALTATATQVVQDDIVQRLGCHDARRHIHGFRRTNIAIEIVEAPLGARFAAVEKLMADTVNLPAVVYAPTRKLTETVAERLAGICRAEAYHAGFAAGLRHDVQNRFLSGESDVIVATTAFGMGIDKSNIRTVVHMALPATIEAYYQEIGRAGRDGLASRAVMFFSGEDLKTLEFFHNKNYPDPTVVAAVFEQIPREGIFKTALGGDIDLDTLDGALQKLWIHGGIDYRHDDMVLPLSPGWLASYLEQKEHNKRQLQDIDAFSRSGRRCRMEMLLHYFGDASDQQGPCGLCDICAPGVCSVQSFREPTAEEGQWLADFRSFLCERPPEAVGRLYSDFAEKSGLRREHFDLMVQGLVRAGYLRSAVRSFVKDGRTISYRTLAISTRGRITAAHEWAQVALAAPVLASHGRPAKVKKRQKAKEPPARKSAKELPARKGATADRGAIIATAVNGPMPQGNALAVEQKLRAWRSREAQARKVPAFCIFSDKVLTAIASERPRDETALLGISGIGRAKATKFGPRIFEIVRSACEET